MNDPLVRKEEGGRRKEEGGRRKKRRERTLICINIKRKRKREKNGKEVGERWRGRGVFERAA